MSLSSQQLVERALRRAKSPGDVTAARSRLLVLIPDALKELAGMMAADPDRADLLRKDFTLTISSGVASLTAALTASEPMLLGFLKFAKITSSDSAYPWQYFPDFASLNLSRPTFGLIGFAVEGSSMQVANANGATGTLSTTATANASYIPALSSVSGNLDLEETLVTALASLYTDDPAEAEGLAA